MLEKSEHKKQLVLGVILVVVFVFLLCFFLYLFLSYVKVLNTQSHLVPTPTPTPAKPDIYLNTANWKTYRNTKIGFEIKFPQQYFPPMLPSGSNPLYATSQEKNGIILFGENKYSLELTTLNNNLDNLSKIANGGQAYAFENEPDRKIMKKKIMVDNQPALLLIKEYKQQVNGSVSNYIGVFFNGNNKGFGLTVHNGNIDEFDQILSTFRFLDEAITPSPKMLLGTPYKVVATKLISPDEKFIIGQLQVDNYSTIEVARHNSGTAQYITTDLVKYYGNELGYGNKFQCPCTIYFKGWYADDKFIISIDNTLGEEYEYIVEIYDEENEIKVVETSLRRIK